MVRLQLLVDAFGICLSGIGILFAIYLFIDQGKYIFNKIQGPRPTLKTVGSQSKEASSPINDFQIHLNGRFCFAMSPLDRFISISFIAALLYFIVSFALLSIKVISNESNRDKMPRVCGYFRYGVLCVYPFFLFCYYGTLIYRSYVSFHESVYAHNGWFLISLITIKSIHFF